MYFLILNYTINLDEVSKGGKQGINKINDMFANTACMSSLRGLSVGLAR